MTPEIMTRLKGTRFLLAGLEKVEGLEIATLLSGAGAVGIPGTYEQCSPGFCDAMIVKLGESAGHEIETIPAVPALAAVAAKDIAHASENAYIRCSDFVCFPWQPAELLVRASRLLASRQVESATPANRQISVLIADDDPAVTTLLKTILSGHMDCRVARNGFQALQLLKTAPPHVVFLDVNMPVMNGFEVLEAIRREPGMKNLPVILLTAQDSLADIERGRTLGANDYIVKPFRANTILQRVRRLLLTQAGT
ncbi:MAG: response regulator [Acidobacteriota bacterium]|nr:response regulator [Acidobacteriota bacterium]